MALKIIAKKAAEGGTFEFKQGINDSRMLYLCSLDTSNIKVLKLYMRQFSPLGMVDFPKANWSNLTIIELCTRPPIEEYSRMQSKGCKYLTQASINRLRILNLYGNYMGNEGAGHLAKGEWKFIRQINIGSSRINNGAIMDLNKGNWKLLQNADITSYYLKNKYLLLSAVLTEFKAITEIKIENKYSAPIMDHKIRRLFAQKFGRLKI